MPQYIPIDSAPSFDWDKSELLKVHWEPIAFHADFTFPAERDCAIRVRFDNQVIVRILDEMALCTGPDETKWSPSSFAYLVEGAAFAASQSELWKMQAGGAVRHYQFVTAWGCLDVLSPEEPIFQIVKKVP